MSSYVVLAESETVPSSSTLYESDMCVWYSPLALRPLPPSSICAVMSRSPSAMVYVAGMAAGKPPPAASRRSLTPVKS